MALYDRYSDVMSGHPPLIQRMEHARQERLLDAIARHLPAGRAVRALEIGIGIGLFARACRARQWGYVGVDRNEKMLARLRGDFEVVSGEVPPLPREVGDGTCDLAYSAFVVEHLADGTDAFRYIAEMKRAVRPGGLVTIVVPDALSLGLEFWNLDYTHRYPTAERNITQILLENELEVVRTFRYRGAGWTGLRYWLCRVAGWFYRYRFWSALTGNKLLPYSVYQYVNQDILVFIARKRDAAT